MHSLVIGQIRTDEKSNEITAIPELLNMLDIKGKSSQLMRWVARKILQRRYKKQGGDYLFAVKETGGG
ncbi:hypothetical protein [Escherichia coli]|uniref:hypothetical protein n=1 Tax=Escherichia coli TaxID=562 RepID=UPI0035AF28A0